jgi:hypothetical protein
MARSHHMHHDDSSHQQQARKSPTLLTKQIRTYENATCNIITTLTGQSTGSLSQRQLSAKLEKLHNSHLECFPITTPTASPPTVASVTDCLLVRWEAQIPTSVVVMHDFEAREPIRQRRQTASWDTARYGLNWATQLLVVPFSVQRDCSTTKANVLNEC